MEVKIGRVSLQIPVYGTEDATLRIVHELNERLKRVEAESDRIDTQAFALKVAASFAAEADDLREQADQEKRELLLALHRVSESLRALLRQAQPNDSR